MGRRRKIIHDLRRSQCGFTLMELLVVMIVLAILVGGLGSRLMIDPQAPLRDEARRLALLIHSAQDQAILDGRFYGIRFDADGYAFLVLNDKGELAPLAGDDVFRARRLPDEMELTDVQINGKTLEGDNRGLVLTPLGDLPSLLITLSDKKHRWQVSSHPDGRVTFAAIDA